MLRSNTIKSAIARFCRPSTLLNSNTQNATIVTVANGFASTRKPAMSSIFQCTSRIQNSVRPFWLAAPAYTRTLAIFTTQKQSESSTPIIPSSMKVVKSGADQILHRAQHHNYPRARAVLKRFKTSVKKLKLVCKLVRRARVDAALMQLSLSPKRVSKSVRKAIYDAKFNAANNHGMDPDNLLVDELIIGRSSYLKRIDIKGRGRTGLRKLPYCYLACYVREVRPEDRMVGNHLARRTPRWKSGGVRK